MKTKLKLIGTIVVIVFAILIVPIIYKRYTGVFNNLPEPAREPPLAEVIIDWIKNDAKEEVREIELVKEAIKAKRTFETIENARITAYTTRPEEGTTCLSTSGLNLCHRYEELNQNLIACPTKYPFGTAIGIPIGINQLGNKIVERYICVDRMSLSHRNKNHFDIYFGRGEDRVREADIWGIKFLDIKVLD